MKYALEIPCILFISVFRRDSYPKVYRNSLNLLIVTLRSCTWESSVLDRISYVSCFVVCEQGQETLEPQQHSEHSWFWEIQQWPHYFTICYWHLEHPGMPSAISSVNVRSPTHIWIMPFNRLGFCGTCYSICILSFFFFGNSWIQLSDQCASYSLQLISSLMALALFNLVLTWPISAWLTFHNMECKLWVKTEMH
jgi:hypothetical protein